MVKVTVNDQNMTVSRLYLLNPWSFCNLDLALFNSIKSQNVLLKKKWIVVFKVKVTAKL